MEDGPSRKLAVLLHADVVGSTGLVRIDETLAHHEFISSQQGIAHELRGDALIAVFSRVSDAVAASLDFQAANAANNKKLTDEICPVVRVGIAMGEVLVADHTITGEGIVLAQRLEQLAEPGGVCIQGAAYETVPERMPFEFEDLGECELKGFDRPVRAYSVRSAPDSLNEEPDAAISPEMISLELPDEPSLAVLPFTNMSGDPEQEFFSDGITEDIITALSRISGLLVVARNSTMVYKGKAVDVKQVGREQGVRYVLEGSVRKAGNRVRVTAQLIDAMTGHHLWADRYDRKLDDVFEVQDEITGKIIVEMRVQIAEGEEVRRWIGGTDSVQAWESVARGNSIFLSNVREKNIEARRLAEAALNIDPDYINATVLLGHTHWFDAFWRWSESKNQSMERALACGNRALELDEGHPDSRMLLAACASLQGEHDRAIQLAEEAVNLGPSNASNVHWLGWILRGAGRYRKAIGWVQRAMRLSPIYPPVRLNIVGSCYHLMGENRLAIPNLREATRREPEASSYKAWLASALVEAELDEWQGVAEDILSVDPEFSATAWAETFRFFRDQTWVERVLANLLKVGLPE